MLVDETNDAFDKLEKDIQLVETRAFMTRDGVRRVRNPKLVAEVIKMRIELEARRIELHRVAHGLDDTAAYWTAVLAEICAESHDTQVRIMRRLKKFNDHCRKNNGPSPTVDVSAAVESGNSGREPPR